MARRLTLAGMRPINVVVDVSNYVMLDLGQPNHAYDLDQLAGGGLLIRRGRPDERLVTLDEVERVLGSNDCVICDAEGTPVGVGGIMGGSRAEIGPGTRRVLLEGGLVPAHGRGPDRGPAGAAFRGPGAIRARRRPRDRRSGRRALRGVAVDGAVRRERVGRGGRPAPGGPAPGSASTLRRGPTVDVRSPSLPGPVSVPLRTARVNAIIGSDLDDATVAGLLEPIGFSVQSDGPGAATVRIPSWRLDSEREIDVIEEVARTWGYGRIERTIPPGAPGGSGGLTEPAAPGASPAGRPEPGPATTRPGRPRSSLPGTSSGPG